MVHRQSGRSTTVVQSSLFERIYRFLVGKPRDLGDRSVFHNLSLIPFLAWVGLGADGLSSSSYGPEEAFKTLGEHQYLAVALVLVMAMTVLIISAAYRRIIEDFPHGGGGYVVASKLLGNKVGLVSGCALLVDYVLTITVSIAAAGDAIFSFLPHGLHSFKMPFEIGTILALTIINIRGVKESVVILAPIFITFVITHLILILWGIVGHIPEFPTTANSVVSGYQSGMVTLGPLAMLLLFIHAYSLGGGTYTGIEAVSNGLPIMREPRAETAKRTMLYMAASLAFTASGLLLCYLLWKVAPVEGKTMNAVLLEKIAGQSPMGMTFVIVSLLAEGLLLVVAAQAGFIDGPRVLANMAVDSWMPRRFAALSERLTTSNGIVLMGLASLVALIYTKGNVAAVVVMYSINVFLTFSLSIFGMLRSYIKERKTKNRAASGITIFAIGFVLCATILAITVVEKFKEGGWITLVVTGSVVILCLNIKSHYVSVAKKLGKFYSVLQNIPQHASKEVANLLDPKGRTAVILVGGYGGLGIHTAQSILKVFPGLYRNFIFVSVGVVDSGGFKGEGSIDDLRVETENMLQKYADLGQKLGIPSAYRYSIGTDVVEEAAKLCQHIANEFVETTFFAGKVVFSQERWYQRLLHNETGFNVQKRLQLAGHTMVILPAKLV